MWIFLRIKIIYLMHKLNSFRWILNLNFLISYCKRSNCFVRFLYLSLIFIDFCLNTFTLSSFIFFFEIFYLVTLISTIENFAFQLFCSGSNGTCFSNSWSSFNNETSKFPAVLFKNLVLVVWIFISEIIK